MNRALLLTGLAIMIQYNLPAQSSLLLENYYYKGQGINTVVPMFHLETKNNWYGELRYNYEDINTLSLYAGKTIAGGNALQYCITPLLGYSAGRFRGPSFAVNAEAEWKNFFASSQTQYSLSLKTTEESFFFTWSEAGYAICDYFFAGLALQYTRLNCGDNFEPGFVAGLSFKNISFPCYIFSPFQAERYFVFGLNYEFSLKKKKQVTL